MIKVGCPDCGIKFFVLAELVNTEEIPHMIYDDWSRLTKFGVFSLKGYCKKEEDKLQPSLLRIDEL